jgi:hypothetical protein
MTNETMNEVKTGDRITLREIVTQKDFTGTVIKTQDIGSVQTGALVTILTDDKRQVEGWECNAKKETAAPANQIDITKVFEVYSGRADKCCCGCAGNYTASTEGKELSKSRKGYDDGTTPNDRTVAQIVGRMNAAVNAGTATLDRISDEQVCVEVGNRLYMAFLKPEAKQS